jgi:hypothetical protein
MGRLESSADSRRARRRRSGFDGNGHWEARRRLTGVSLKWAAPESALIGRKLGRDLQFGVAPHSGHLGRQRRREGRRDRRRRLHTSVWSEISRAPSTSVPRYLTVDSSRRPSIEATFGLDWELVVQVLKRKGTRHEGFIRLESVPGGLETVLTPRLKKPSRLISAREDAPHCNRRRSRLHRGRGVTAPLRWQARAARAHPHRGCRA